MKKKEDGGFNLKSIMLISIIFSIMGISSYFYPKMILFTIPLLLFFMLIGYSKRRILYGFSAFASIFVFLVIVTDITFSGTGLVIYNDFKNNIIDTGLGDVRSIGLRHNLLDFEEGFDVETIQIVKKDTVEGSYSIVDGGYSGKNSLKVDIIHPMPFPLSVKIPLENVSMEEYSYLNLWLENTGDMGWFGIVLVDSDGDWWHYDNSDVFSKDGWNLIKIPIASMINYQWSNHGDRRMSDMVEVWIKFDPGKDPFKEGEFSAKIDDIYLSDI